MEVVVQRIKIGSIAAGIFGGTLPHFLLWWRHFDSIWFISPGVICGALSLLLGGFLGYWVYKRTNNPSFGTLGIALLAGIAAAVVTFIAEIFISPQ